MGDRKESKLVSGETFSDPTVASSEAAHKKKKSKQNWRLGVLAQPRVARQKYQEPDYVFSSGVSPGALKTECKERIEHMSRPPLRLLVVNKKTFTGLPGTYPDYDERMDKKIETTWNSMYNEYRKARRDLKIKQREASAGSHRSRRSSRGKGGKGKGGKGDKKGAKGGKEKGGKGGKGKDKGDGKKSGKKADTSSIKSAEEMEKEFAEWCALRSQPKPVHEPEPLAVSTVVEKYRNRNFVY